MNFKHHLEIAWNLTLKFIFPLILLTLVMLAASFFTLGILAPVAMAGYMQSLLRLVRDHREPQVGDVFSQMGLFIPLLIFGLAVTVIVALGFMLLVLPGLLAALAVSFLCIYMLPLMTDRDLGLVEAIRTSCALAIRGDIAEHVVVVLIFMAISGIGSSFFVGALFTQPLATLFLISVYLERTRDGLPEPV